MTVIQRLYSLSSSSPELYRCLYDLIQTDDEEQYLSSLQGSELTRLVDFLDGVHPSPPVSLQLMKQTLQLLDVTPITDDVSRRCLHKLQAICGRHNVLPSSYNVSGDLTRVVSRTGIFHVLFALFSLTFTDTILQTRSYHPHHTRSNPFRPLTQFTDQQKNACIEPMT